MRTVPRRPIPASLPRLCSLLLLAGSLGIADPAAAAPPPTGIITDQEILNLAGGGGSFWVFDTFDTDGPGVGGDPTLAIAPSPALLNGYGTRAVRMDSGPGSGGIGCTRLGGKAFLGTQSLEGLRLSELTELGFSHLVESNSGAPAAAALTPSVNIYVDRNGDGQWRGADDSILIYEPYYTLGAPTLGNWYDNQVIGPGATGRWHYAAQPLPGIGLFLPSSVDLWPEVIAQLVGGAGFDPTATTMGDLRIVNPVPGCAAGNSEEGTGSGLVIAVGQKFGTPWDNFVVFIDGVYVTAFGADPVSFAHNFDATFIVGGTVSGLSGSDLVLQNNLGDDLSIAADGAFTFATALVDGSGYSVTVATQPTLPSQTCSVSSGGGTLDGADVANVQVTCTTNSFTIGGTVTGLSGTGPVLQNNGGDNLLVNANGSFTFGTPILDGSSYAVAVLTQPGNPSQTCTIGGGSGTVAGANVVNVVVTCATDTFTVGGTVSGLAGSGLVLQNNGGDDLAIAANGVFTFGIALAHSGSYAVSVLTQPTSPSQTCSVSNGGGTVAGANVTAVAVACVNDPPLAGLSSSTLDFGHVQQGGNGSATLTVSNTGSGVLEISQITAPATPFAIVGGSCTTVPVTLLTGESCQITVRFSPDASGTFAGSFTLVSNDPASPTTVLLTGISQAAVVQISTLDRDGLLLLMLGLALVGGLSLRRVG